MRLMPALSIRQPWAWLIVHGYKDIENRAWFTPLRTRFLVHAGKTFPRAYYDQVTSELARAGLLPPEYPPFESMPTGGVVGAVDLIDCVSQSPSPWFIPDGYGFVLANPEPMSLWPMPGKLGFFNVQVQ